MAKRGLALYFTLSLGFTMIGYMFFAHFRYSQPAIDRDPESENIWHKADNTESLQTQRQIRKQGERTISKEVPTSDDSEGYM